MPKPTILVISAAIPLLLLLLMALLPLVSIQEPTVDEPASSSASHEPIFQEVAQESASPAPMSTLPGTPAQTLARESGPLDLATIQFASIADFVPHFPDPVLYEYTDAGKKRRGLISADTLYHVMPDYMLQLRLTGKDASPIVPDTPELYGLAQKFLLLAADKWEYMGRQALALVEQGQATLVGCPSEVPPGPCARVPFGYVILSVEQASAIRDSPGYQ